MTLTGECFCGDTKYEVEGRLVDPLACHCSRCRKAFSGSSSNYARVESGSFRWVAGEENLRSYVGEHGFGWMFCGHCGSTLCGTMEGGVHGVTLGCLNDDPELDPIHHVFVASRAPWDELPRGARTFDEGRAPEDRR